MQASFADRVAELETAYRAARELGKVWSAGDLQAKAVAWWGIPMMQADRMARIVSDSATL